MRGSYEKDHCGEQGQGGVEDTLVDHLDCGARTDDDCLDEPGQPETHQNVKHVTSDGITDGHVSMSLLDHGHTGETVRNTDPGSYEGEPHDGVRDAEGEANDGDHPDHDIAVHADPGDGHQK